MSITPNVSICSTGNALSSYLDSLFSTPDYVTEEKITDRISETFPDIFDVMLFQVLGITLAIEARYITSITIASNCDDERYLKSHFDISHLLRPGSSISRQGEEPLYHIHIEGLDYPLLSEFVGGVVPVYKSRITWRTDSGKRQWLAGTMPEMKCGVLDISGLILACSGILTA
ncbi:MAG: hypothetical protein V3V12_07675 [Gammaproteobacteria bacterium]